MALQIHLKIKNKLSNFIYHNRVPNLLLHGCYGTGKKTILFDFINEIYNNDSSLIKKYTMILNCTQDKGIKMIRDDLKFFSKTNIPNIQFNENHNVKYKLIVLLNVEFLTIDAQSALRRCMELYSHSTRFFMVAVNKEKILKPILSRVCDIYIPYTKVGKKLVNLNTYNCNLNFNIDTITKNLYTNLRSQINSFCSSEKSRSKVNIINFAKTLYNQGSLLEDILKILENNKEINKNLEKKEIIEKTMIISRLEKNSRSDLLLIYYSLYLFLMSSNLKIENVFFN